MEIQKDHVLSVRITETLRVAIQRTADASGLTSGDWVRAVLARAANEGAFAPRKGGKADGRKARR
jgi:antitoxin component of RelBE/YafQ-DinJ toxin-antitoxin module